MADEISTKKQHELGDLGFAGVPAIISAAGRKASFRFIEFFPANLRNPNTRVSYGRAVREFCLWCEDRGLQLQELNPVMVAGYVELLGKPVEKHGRGYSKPSVKQHLAAIRMLFDQVVHEVASGLSCAGFPEEAIAKAKALQITLNRRPSEPQMGNIAS